MTLLFIDGFDVGDIAAKWFVTTNHTTHVTAVVSTRVPFGFGRSVSIPEDWQFGGENSIGNPMCKLIHAITPSDKVFFGVNFTFDATTRFTDDHYCIARFFTDNTKEHLSLQLARDGSVEVWRSDGQIFPATDTRLGASASGVVKPGIFTFLEVGLAVGSAGSVELRANERSLFTFSGQTKVAYPSSGSQINTVMLGGSRPSFVGNFTPTVFYDDVYAANDLDDGIGPANNTFLGLCRVQTLLPDGPGASTDLVPVGSPNNWDNVNDVPYSVIDYNTSSTPGDRDTYTLDNLVSDTGQVFGVQTVIIASASDATARIKAALRSGGTVYYDPAVALDGIPSDVSVVLREDDPATSAAWTVTAVNNLEAGVEITT